MSVHRVIVVGGGFGGLQAATHLASAPVELTLVDRRNFHLFQPLSYQVATGALSAGEVCYPLRAIFKRHSNVRVVLGEVVGFDLGARQLHVEPGAGEGRQLVLTFVVVGAGPTGAEMAGQIAELARDTLRRDFRAIDPANARVLLVEASERVLPTFPPSLSRRAANALVRLGATPLLGRTVVDVDENGVGIASSGGEQDRIAARTVVWAAGVMASGLAAQLAEITGGELDRAGRIAVEPDLTLQGHPEVLALGDMVRVRDLHGEPHVLPGVAPVAMQEGRYAARLIRARLRGERVRPFHYVDKGNLATIGRASAVADLHLVRVSGLPAWITWLVVHLWYLVGFQNRLLVILHWAFSFIARGRGARLISPEPTLHELGAELGAPGR